MNKDFRQFIIDLPTVHYSLIKSRVENDPFCKYASDDLIKESIDFVIKDPNYDLDSIFCFDDGCFTENIDNVSFLVVDVIKNMLPRWKHALYSGYDRLGKRMLPAFHRELAYIEGLQGITLSIVRDCFESNEIKILRGLEAQKIGLKAKEIREETYTSIKNILLREYGRL